MRSEETFTGWMDKIRYFVLPWAKLFFLGAIRNDKQISHL